MSNIINKAVPNANFFRTAGGQSTVVYMLNQGMCNASCKHCYVNTLQEPGKARNIEDAHKDITALLSQGYKVILRGTEILLNPDYLELFQLVGQNYLQTNGIVIVDNPEITARLLSSGIKHLIFTYSLFDNDLLSTPVTVVDNAVRITVDKFSITLSYIVTKEFHENPQLLDKACKAAIKIGARAVKFVRLIPTNHDLKAISLNTSESEFVLSSINDLKSKYSYDDLIIQTPGCFGNFEHRRSLNGHKYKNFDLLGVYDCPAGVMHFVIGATNQVYPCLYLMDNYHRIGFFNGKEIVISNDVSSGCLRSPECPAFEYWVEKDIC